MSEIEQLDADELDAAQLDAAQVNPGPVAVPSAEVGASVAIDMLDGDEMIQLSIKPSLWYVPLVSAQVVAVMLLVAGVAAVLGSSMGWTSIVRLAFQVSIIGAVLRIAFASLQWASRLYLLTNRRVMTFRGVLSVRVSQSRLVRIGDVHLDSPWYERLLGLGTLRMQSRFENEEALIWSSLARPNEVYELLIRAIRKSQNGP